MSSVSPRDLVHPRSHRLHLLHHHHHPTPSPRAAASTLAICSPPSRRTPGHIQLCGSDTARITLTIDSGREGGRRRIRWRYSLHRLSTAMDDDSIGVPSLLDDSDGIPGGKPYMLSSSEGEESDTELLISTNGDLELPISRDRLATPDSALTVTAHRIATLRPGRRKRGILQGVFINIGLVAFLSIFLLLVDWCSWRIVRLPFQPFYLTRPFLISLVLSASAGYFYVPLLHKMKIYQILRKEGPGLHSLKKGTPTMGGLFFIPIGIAVARFITGFSSIEVYGAATATLAFAAIGLLDDTLTLVKNHNSGLPGFAKFLLQVAVGTWFSFWLDYTKLSSPYNMKFLVPLPLQAGLVYLGKIYLVLTAFCFVSMGNGVNLTDGLDGLAGGIAALAFLGMCVAVLPICPDLSIFGASMAGACVGFLCHNRYKASIFMGDTGSLALGGALAAMAACTGMFLPLFVSSGIFALEALSAAMQVFYFKATKHMSGSGRRLFRMAPFHHHLELCGLKEPVIVASAYILSCMLSLFAAYIGLISA